MILPVVLLVIGAAIAFGGFGFFLWSFIPYIVKVLGATASTLGESSNPLMERYAGAGEEGEEAAEDLFDELVNGFLKLFVRAIIGMIIMAVGCLLSSLGLILGAWQVIQHLIG